MLRKLFGRKRKPPTLPLEDRPQPSAITHNDITDRDITDRGPATSSVESRDVGDAEFDEVVLQSDRLVVVDFWAEWCQPCTIISTYVGWLGRDFGAQLLVVALDVDENPDIPQRYTIMGLPTLLYMRDGVEVGRQVGLLTYEELQAQVAALLEQPAV